MSTINEKAAKRRKQIEDILVRKYEHKFISISGIDQSNNPDKWGELKSIGVEWLGNDEYQIILNLNACRIVMDYEDFLVRVEVLNDF